MSEKSLPTYAVFQLGQDGDFVAIKEDMFSTESTLKAELQRATAIPECVDLLKLNYMICYAPNACEAVVNAVQSGFKYREPRPNV